MVASSLDTRSAQNRRSYLWLFIGAGLLLFSNGRWTIPLATWLAPVFLIRFARTHPAMKGLGLVLVVNVLASLFFWQGIIPGGLYLPVACGIAVVYWLPYLADRLLVNRLPGLAATLAFPLLQVSLEYINTVTNPLGSWGSLAYTQHSFLPLLQLLSITGMWGLSFLIAWLAPVVNWAWEQDFALQRVRSGVLTYGGILALVLVYGSGRMAYFPPRSETLQVASLTQTVDHFKFVQMKMEELRASREQLQELGEGLLQQSRRQAQAGADVIVWQEGGAIMLLEDEASFIDKARALAQEEKVYLLLGLVTLPEAFPNVKADNQAIWITPAGDVKWRYLKGRPVPGERVVAGDGVIPLDQTVLSDISSVICFDMDHPVYIRQAGRSGADVMLVPANDWRDIVPFHTYMASLRGIEYGFSLVRAAGHGLSAAFDYQGRPQATADYSTTKQAMISHVPTQGVKTIYTVIGDLFAWLCIAGFVILVGLALVRPIRS
ncbi:MAG TPA: nitrilase-related carbon-nitrogen hydrolase [bacterium]|nr:nitrilase-related carbon-nitrogen hydrolase [bacterium]HPN46272.1 nitrilase-related carbon-nitrogen hydrolase [bacterium]